MACAVCLDLNPLKWEASNGAYDFYDGNKVDDRTIDISWKDPYPTALDEIQEAEPPPESLTASASRGCQSCLLIKNGVSEVLGFDDHIKSLQLFGSTSDRTLKVVIMTRCYECTHGFGLSAQSTWVITLEFFVLTGELRTKSHSYSAITFANLCRVPLSMVHHRAGEEPRT